MNIRCTHRVSALTSGSVTAADSRISFSQSLPADCVAARVLWRVLVRAGNVQTRKCAVVKTNPFEIRLEKAVMRSRDCAQKIRLLIVDDHPILREGVRGLIDLQPDMVVCGESESVSDALTIATELQPDVATVDLKLGKESGLELIRRLRVVGCAKKILALSAHEERAYEYAALAAGADGYVTKLSPGRTLIRAIRELEPVRDFDDEIGACGFKPLFHSGDTTHPLEAVCV